VLTKSDGVVNPLPTLSLRADWDYWKWNH
jgi:hypothetical protein